MKYRVRYGDQALARWVGWMGRQDRPVWAYFNNDIDVAAPADALALGSMVGQAGR